MAKQGLGGALKVGVSTPAGPASYLEVTDAQTRLPGPWDPAWCSALLAWLISVHLPQGGQALSHLEVSGALICLCLAPQTADSAIISTSGQRLNLFPGKPQGLLSPHLRPPEELCASLEMLGDTAKEGKVRTTMSLGQRLSQGATNTGAHLPLSLHCSPAPASSCSLLLGFCPTGHGLCCSLCPECPLLALPRAVQLIRHLRNAPVIALCHCCHTGPSERPSKP